MIRDPLTGEATLLGATRAQRPNEFVDGPEARCAFCPGNEAATPPEIARVGTPARWEARAFRNKYPAIVPPDGLHEVIVDARDHVDEVTAAGMELWRSRYLAALSEMPHGYPVLFKNAGAQAGATLVHPHTQLIVVPERPERWARMISNGATCAWCAERSIDEQAVVARREHAVAYVRTNSRFSWSLVIAPLACAPSLRDARDDEWRAVTGLASEAVSALRRELGERASFNLLLFSDPDTADGSFHWHLELVPRLHTLAGFELSTGMFIRGAAAKESAARWRRMIAPPDGPI